MKQVQFTLILSVLFCSVALQSQNVGIGTSDPDSSAVLEITSTDRGVLLPRLTTGQRVSVSNPAIGLLVFDTNTESFWFYETAGWLELNGGMPDKITDADNDTKIQVENNADEDIIHFDMAGTEFFRMDSGRLEVLNTGKSLFIGQRAGEADDLSDNRNVFIGESAGRFNTTGINNVALGYQTLNSNVDGNNNNAIGYNALNNNIGSNNNAFGNSALKNNGTGEKNTVMGDSAMYRNGGGSENTAIGNFAGHFNILGSRNVMIGNSAGKGLGIHNKHDNVLIGYEAGGESHGSNNVFIGSQAGKTAGASNRLYIENSNSSSPLIYGEFNNDLLRINGTLNINNAYSFPVSDGTSGQVMQTNGSGSLSWANKTTNTDDQTVDALVLNGSTLEISIENDGQAAVTVDLSSLAPVGSIMMYYGISAPANWLICDGSTFNAATYPQLDALLEGNTLPDFSGRFAMGVGDSGTAGSTNHTFASGGGEEKHTLSTGEMPAHKHNVTITYREGSEQGSSNNYSDLGGGSSSSSTYTSASKGGGNAHNNLPPYLTVNYIIKAK